MILTIEPVAAVGRTVERVAYSYGDDAKIKFTDGTVLIFKIERGDWDTLTTGDATDIDAYDEYQLGFIDQVELDRRFALRRAAETVDVLRRDVEELERLKKKLGMS